MTPLWLILALAAAFVAGLGAGILLTVLYAAVVAGADHPPHAPGFDPALLTSGPALRIVRWPRGTTDANRERARVRAFVEARKLT